MKTCYFTYSLNKYAMQTNRKRSETERASKLFRATLILMFLFGLIGQELPALAVPSQKQEQLPRTELGRLVLEKAKGNLASLTDLKKQPFVYPSDSSTSLGPMVTASQYESAGAIGKARSIYQRFLRTAKSSYEISQIAEFEERNLNFAGAFDVLSKYQGDDPSYMAGQKVEFLTRQNQSQLALKAADYCATTYGRFEPRAIYWEHKGDYYKAAADRHNQIKRLALAAKKDDSEIHVWSLYGLDLGKCGRRAEALKAFENGYPVSLLFRAQFWSEVDSNHEKAEADLKEFIALFKEHPNFWYFQAYRRLSELYLKQYDTRSKAVELWKQVRAENPNTKIIPFIRNIIECYAEVGKCNEAMTFLIEQKSFIPDSVWDYPILAKILDGVGDDIAANKLRSIFVQIRPHFSNAEWFRELANELARQGRHDQANRFDDVADYLENKGLPTKTSFRSFDSDPAVDRSAEWANEANSANLEALRRTKGKAKIKASESSIRTIKIDKRQGSQNPAMNVQPPKPVRLPAAK